MLLLPFHWRWQLPVPAKGVTKHRQRTTGLPHVPCWAFLALFLGQEVLALCSDFTDCEKAPPCSLLQLEPLLKRHPGTPCQSYLHAPAQLWLWLQ